MGRDLTIIGDAKKLSRKIQILTNYIDTWGTIPRKKTSVTTAKNDLEFYKRKYSDLKITKRHIASIKGAVNRRKKKQTLLDALNRSFTDIPSHRVVTEGGGNVWFYGSKEECYKYISSTGLMFLEVKRNRKIK